MTLIAAGATKLMAGSSVVLGSILGYGILPRRIAKITSMTLPATEISLGVALVAGVYAPIPALCAFVLIMVFTGVVGLNLIKGREVDCGCFGRSNQPGERSSISAAIIIRNMFLLLSLVGYVQIRAMAQASNQLAKHGEFQVPHDPLSTAMTLAWLLNLVVYVSGWMIQRLTRGTIRRKQEFERRIQT